MGASRARPLLRTVGIDACVLVAVLAAGTVSAQTPSILLEACNAMEPASKRLECLRAARGQDSASGGVNEGAMTPRAAYAATKPTPASATSTSRSGVGQTCYTGPRGGTYTITASGRKNYNGC